MWTIAPSSITVSIWGQLGHLGLDTSLHRLLNVSGPVTALLEPASTVPTHFPDPTALPATKLLLQLLNHPKRNKQLCKVTKLMKPGFLHFSSLPLVSEDEVPVEVFDIIGHLYVGVFFSPILIFYSLGPCLKTNWKPLETCRNLLIFETFMFLSSSDEISK